MPRLESVDRPTVSSSVARVHSSAASHPSSIGQVWHQVISVQPTPPSAVVLVTAAVGLLVVLVRSAWLLARNVVTIAHEGGHALVALLVGRRLRGVLLHSDTSGVTLSRGRPHGPGMIATTLAGYLAPSLLALGCAALLASGHVTALLWLTIALLIAMLMLVRNAYGVASILVTSAAIFAISWFATSAVQAAFAYGFMWFLSFAGIRPVLELQAARRRGRARDSDADQLAALTGTPGLLWVVFFGLISLGILAMTIFWLLPLRDWTPELV
jgi:hypothetical protein